MAWRSVAVLCAAISEAGGFIPAAWVGARYGLATSTKAQRSEVRLHAVPLNKGTHDAVTFGIEALESLGYLVRAGFYTLGKNDEQRIERMAIAVDSIHSTTLALNQALDGDGLIERGCFAAFNCTVSWAVADDQNPSLLVYGERGVGKTSIVEATLHGTAGVLGMLYHRGNGTDFEQRLERLVLKCGGLSHNAATGRIAHRLRAIMAFYQRVHNRRPIVVVDIDYNMKPATLSELLMAAKQLGFQEKLATFIFVVSAYRNALGLPIGFRESRVEGYRAPDFNTTEAHKYLAKPLRPSPELAEFVVQQIGTLAMDLVEVCSRCRGVESETECRERVASYRTECIDDAWYALDGFLAIAKDNATFSKDASLAFLRQLLLASDDDAALAGTCVQTDLDAADAFGFKKPNLLLLALAQYHAFAVDP